MRLTEPSLSNVMLYWCIKSFVDILSITSVFVLGCFGLLWDGHVFLQLNLNLVDFTKCMNFIRLNFRLAQKDCLKVSFLRPKHLPVAIMISWFRYQIYQINHIVQESTSDWNQLQSLANRMYIRCDANCLAGLEAINLWFTFFQY